MCTLTSAFAALSPADVAGHWKGTYQCTQGETGIDVDLEAADGNQIQGRVNFYTLPGSRVQFPAASYTVSGRLDGNGSLLLKPGRWIHRPVPLFMGTLDGRFSADGKQYTGVVVECGRNRDLRVARVEGTAPAAAVAAAPETTAGAAMATKPPADGAAEPAQPASAERAPADRPLGAYPIVGVRTGMTAGEVQSVLKAAGYTLEAYKVLYRYASPLTGAWTQDPAPQMIGEVRARPAKPSDGSKPVDEISVFFTPVPGGEQAYSVFRNVSYTRANAQPILVEELRKAMREKYGAPLVDGMTQASGNYSIFWTEATNVTVLKPWLREPDAGMVAIVCGQNAHLGGGVAVDYMHLNPLEPGVGADPREMAEHCSEAFLSVRLSVSGGAGAMPSAAGADAVVYEFQATSYDGHLAASGRQVLVAASAAAKVRATRQQTEKGRATKPDL